MADFVWKQRLLPIPHKKRDIIFLILFFRKRVIRNCLCLLATKRPSLLSANGSANTGYCTDAQTLLKVTLVPNADIQIQKFCRIDQRTFMSLPLQTDTVTDFMWSVRDASAFLLLFVYDTKCSIPTLSCWCHYNAERSGCHKQWQWL
jgi:hypothetical protein